MHASTKSVIFFIIVYLGSMSLLAAGMGYLYYQNQKKSLVDKMRLEMRYKTKSINAKLEYYHTNQDETFTFYEEGYDIGLFDNNGERIASTLTFKQDKIDFDKLFYLDNNEYILIKALNKEYLDVKYIVVKKPLNSYQINAIINQIIHIALYGFFILLFFALLLSKIMLYPIKRTISSLTNFMKDVTHEMNTPISTILMSYEHMDKENLNQKQQRALSRIDIATKTLSSLYNDLSFASFNDYIEYKDTDLDVKKVIIERVKYFDTLIDFKSLHVTSDLHHKNIQMDKRKLILIIDNLLSNAIKFSKKGGEIHITLTKDYLAVRDNGLGISKEDQEDIFKRFRSGNSLHGGFGVGLDIVNQICKEYHIKIELDSELSKGSEFKLLWKD